MERLSPFGPGPKQISWFCPEKMWKECQKFRFDLILPQQMGLAMFQWLTPKMWPLQIHIVLLGKNRAGLASCKRLSSSIESFFLVGNPLFHQPTSGKDIYPPRMECPCLTSEGYLGSRAPLRGPVQQQLLNESACLGTELDTSADPPKRI